MARSIRIQREGVDQGIHVHGPNGAKYFPGTNMVLDKNGNWTDAGKKFREKFQKAAKCQLSARMLNKLGILSMLAAFIIDDATGETDSQIQEAIANRPYRT